MVGEQVYYTVKSKTLVSGDRVVHGKQGEVVGPATSESHKGKGVAVLFPGNKSAVECYLTSVRRRRRRAATHSSPLRPSYPSSQPTTLLTPQVPASSYFLHTWNQLSPPNPRAMSTCTCTCT